MKRKGNLYQAIISPENLLAADIIAQKGKGDQYGVILFNKNKEENLFRLNGSLRNKTYQTSPYDIFTIHEPKEREIFRLPYYPDRIVHHAIMRPLESIFVSCFTADTYSCIKNRGIHAASYALRGALKDQAGTQYCLKLDIRKFYPSIDHAVLKNLLRRKFKDPDLLWLLEEIIDSAPGLPIGNYLSQYFANYCLSGFDHWLKEKKGIRHYFRYADDLVLLAPDKESLHQLLGEIREYLSVKLHLEIKDNYQVFPVAARGIDFVGYVHFHTHTLLRPEIKHRMARALAKKPSIATIASYYGWVKHCNGNHLFKKLIHEKFQRNGNQSGFPRLRRRQHKNRAVAKPRDRGSVP